MIPSGGIILPKVGADFFLYLLLGGLCQILFMVSLLWLFSFHNFAVGTTMSKLETVMVAGIEVIMLCVLKRLLKPILMDLL